METIIENQVQVTHFEPNNGEPQTRKQKTSYGITREEFTKIWNESNTVQDVLDRTKMSLNLVNVKASQIRKKGIALKKLERKNKAKVVLAAATEFAPTQEEIDNGKV